MQSDSNNSIATSMECEEEILPHLPYILQDFYEIGTKSDIILDILDDLGIKRSQNKLLDIGSGKGAVSIAASRDRGIRCLGVDAMPEFVEFSAEQAKSQGVSEICHFKNADIRTLMSELGFFEVIILGSIGHVLGDLRTSLICLQKHLAVGGYIIWDEGYDDTPKSIMEAIEGTGMQMIKEYLHDDRDRFHEEYEAEFELIVKRCSELCVMFPEMTDRFNSYVEGQKAAYQLLREGFTNSTMVFKRQSDGQ